MYLVASVIAFVCIFLLMVCSGIYLKRRKILNGDSASTISKLIMELVYPALIFSTVASAHLEKDVLKTALSFDIAILCTGIFSFIIARHVLRLDRRSLAPVLLAAMFSGTSLIGTAMLKVVYGGHPENISIGVVVSALSNGFLLNSLGVFIGAHFGSDSKAGISKQILDFLLSKPILALAIGLLWNVLGFPVRGQFADVFMGAISLISTSLPFLAALVTGLTFQLPNFKGVWAPILLVSLCQLVIQPISFYFFAEHFGVSHIYEQIGMLITSLGASPVVVVICNRYNCNTHLASILVVSTTILSAISLPVSAYFIST